jgi:septal ring-binding cell division protein DamX
MMRNSMLVGAVVLTVVALGTAAWVEPEADPDVNGQADIQLQERSRAQQQTEPSPGESTAGAASAEPNQEGETGDVVEVEGIGPDLNTNLK